MAQANHSLSQHTPLTIAQRQRMAIMTLAQLRARNAVKEELKRLQVRLADVAVKDITSWAQVYLEDHPELVAEAKLVVDRWHFGKRGAIRFRR
jgi:hypothetical protein